MSEARERLLGAGSDPDRYLRERRQAGGPPVIGYVCSYAPESVILAAGLHPVRLGARPGPVGPADSRLQSFACSFARGCLDALLTRSGELLAGVVFAYTCDSLRAAAESYRLGRPDGTFFHFLNLPAKVTGPGVGEYAASAVRRLAEALAEVPGTRPVTAESLAAAARLTGSLEAGLRRLAAVRATRPDLLSGSAFIGIARGAAVLDRAEAVHLLDELAGQLETAAGEPGVGIGVETRRGPGVETRRGPGVGRIRPRLLVSGGFLENEQPLRLVEEAGADIVADDLCLGMRRLAMAGRSAESGAGGAGGFQATANALLGRVPCPAKHPPEARFEFVLDEAERTAADGVVFLLQKFCDPHAFDYPALRDRLAAAGLPSLLLEVEQGGLARGQALTRLEAFLERLRSARPDTRRAAGGGRP